MKEYTHGPWAKSDRIEGAIAKGGDPLAICFADNEGNIIWMNDADYTLAVEAPELLRALEVITAEYAYHMLSEYSIEEEELPEVVSARKSIAKVRGQQ